MFCLKKVRNSFIFIIVSTCSLIFLVSQHLNSSKREHVRAVSQLQKMVFPTLGSGDRIREQLEYRPFSKKIKTILLVDEQKAWKGGGVLSGKEMFIKKKCPVDSCVISFNPKTLSKADMVVTRGVSEMKMSLNPEQVWLVYNLESAQTRPWIDSKANWTASYRRDSTLVAPYGKWEYFDEKVKEVEQVRDYSRGREGRVAWLVSNCNAVNKRLEYARKLSQYIPVDIIGGCGEIRCPKGNKTECWKMIAKKYKFYLSFENSNCVDYITEKFWDALKYKVLPVVMGARPEDYTAAAPANSFLHVDDYLGPEDLATHLLALHDNPDQYNQFFSWVGTGKMIDTKFLCRACALLHHPHPQPFHSDLEEWWNPIKSCNKISWSQKWSL